jgi:uncharacterized membrane protein
MNLPALDANQKWYLALTLMIVAAVAIIPYALRVWRDVKEGVDDCASTPEDVLGPLTEAFQEGEISREEYERIRDSVAKTDGPETGMGSTR